MKFYTSVIAYVIDTNISVFRYFRLFAGVACVVRPTTSECNQHFASLTRQRDRLGGPMRGAAVACQRCKGRGRTGSGEVDYGDRYRLLDKNSAHIVFPRKLISCFE